MHKTTLLFFIGLLLSSPLFSQAKLPSQEAIDFHKSRRKALRAKLPANSVAVVFANPTRRISVGASPALVHSIKHKFHF